MSSAQGDTSYQLLPWPPVRNLIAEHLSSAKKTNLIHGLVEMDVTALEEKLRSARRESGKAISRTAYFIFCLAHTMKGYKELQARKWKNRLIIFDDVDVFTTVERFSGKTSVPVGIIIRKAQDKSLEEINAELRAAQRNNPLQYQEVKDRRKLLTYPRWIRSLIWWRMRRDPFMHKQYYGTVALTSLLTETGERSSWGIPISSNPVTLLLAGLYTRPSLMEDGGVAKRKFLSLTFSFDHDIIDGAPAKRFVQDLIKHIESGYGLS